MNSVKIFSPATVANVSCGFDALGFALNAVGDQMILSKTDIPGANISKIEGANLTFDPLKNAASVVSIAMLKEVNANFGIDMQLFKNVKPGSGLGSSASSAAGAAFATNLLLDQPFDILRLTEFARLGETAACGSPIADNVAAALFGGFILVRSYQPLDIIKLPVPPALWVTVIHPQIEIKTEDARAILNPSVSIPDAVKQSANLGGLISGLYTDNYDQISRSLVDVIAEPYRKELIPHFDEIKSKGIENGALGVGISGSGPSMFALSKGEEMAKQIAETMDKVYANSNIKYHIYTSAINKKGMKIIEQS